MTVPHSVDLACPTEACETESTLENSFLDQQSISDESDVILALGLSREDSECDSDFYSDAIYTNSIGMHSRHIPDRDLRWFALTPLALLKSLLLYQ